jgi:hypothetical protein
MKRTTGVLDITMIVHPDSSGYYVPIWTADEEPAPWPLSYALPDHLIDFAPFLVARALTMSGYDDGLHLTVRLRGADRPLLSGRLGNAARPMASEKHGRIIAPRAEAIRHG